LEDNWELVEIGSVCKVDWGNTKLTKRAYVEGGKYLAVSATGGDGRIDHAEHLANTPVLSAIGANCGRMFLPKEKFTAIKNTITLTPEDGLMSGEFLFHLMQSVQLPIRGAGQPFISKGDIQKFLIALPPRDQQERIVKRIEEVQGELEVFQEKLAKRVSLIARFRVQVLSSAFAGEL
jgi:type I restriction enzyme S subunit